MTGLVLIAPGLLAGGSAPGKALDAPSEKAMNAGLSPLKAPFHRPFDYVGMSVAEAAKATRGAPNQVRNIRITSDLADMFLESLGNAITYVDITLKQTAPCRQTRGFDSEPVLGALGISLSELDVARRQTHSHVYYDHQRKLQVMVMCDGDGEPLRVAFSRKYYGR
jgi:hypothetical protein